MYFFDHSFAVSACGLHACGEPQMQRKNASLGFHKQTAIRSKDDHVNKKQEVTVLSTLETEYVAL